MVALPKNVDKRLVDASVGTDVLAFGFETSHAPLRQVLARLVVVPEVPPQSDATSHGSKQPAPLLDSWQRIVEGGHGAVMLRHALAKALCPSGGPANLGVEDLGAWRHEHRKDWRAIVILQLTSVSVSLCKPVRDVVEGLGRFLDVLRDASEQLVHGRGVV